MPIIFLYFNQRAIFHTHIGNNMKYSIDLVITYQHITWLHCEICLDHKRHELYHPLHQSEFDLTWDAILNE